LSVLLLRNNVLPAIIPKIAPIKGNKNIYLGKYRIIVNNMVKLLMVQIIIPPNLEGFMIFTNFAICFDLA
jgi:hypothetical protein